MSRAVMRQALEALENINNWLPTIGQKGLRDYEADAVTAIKAALAQPAHAPTYSELDRIASDLQALCDQQAMRLGALESQSEHPEQMARLGWQYVECPACGSEGARAFPKPEEEPVAIADGTFNHNCPIGSLLYTSPPQRQPLTDAEIWQMVNDCSFNRDLHADKFARAIEAKLKEKNK